MYNRNIRKIRYPQKKDCPFCLSKKNPDYKEVSELAKHVSERGKINSRLRSGVCAKHQRRLSQEIKRARYLALIPF